VTADEAIEAPRAEFDVRGENAEDIDAADSQGRKATVAEEADARTRTADPFITRHDAAVLYRPRSACWRLL